VLSLDLRGEVPPGLGVEGQRWSPAVFGVADENAAVLRVVAEFDGALISRDSAPGGGDIQVLLI
jgi:hypothetical protein